MLVASLVLLIGMLFGGGNVPAFVVEDFPKEVKANVDDKERQKEILSLVKPYEKEFKSVQKELNKSKKKMKKLNLDRNASTEDINEIFDSAVAAWKDLQTTGLETRLVALKMLSEEEWELIISKSLEEFDKKEITDAERKEKIGATFTSFKKDMKNYVDANMNRTIKEMEAFGDLNAAEDELKAAASSVEEARNQFFEGIVTLHFDLVELTTDEEWDKISKSVNKIF